MWGLQGRSLLLPITPLPLIKCRRRHRCRRRFRRYCMDFQSPSLLYYLLRAFTCSHYPFTLQPTLVPISGGGGGGRGDSAWGVPTELDLHTLRAILGAVTLDRPRTVL